MSKVSDYGLQSRAGDQLTVNNDLDDILSPAPGRKAKGSARRLNNIVVRNEDQRSTSKKGSPLISRPQLSNVLKLQAIHPSGMSPLD